MNIVRGTKGVNEMKIINVYDEDIRKNQLFSNRI